MNRILMHKDGARAVAVSVSSSPGLAGLINTANQLLADAYESEKVHLYTDKNGELVLDYADEFSLVYKETFMPVSELFRKLQAQGINRGSFIVDIDAISSFLDCIRSPEIIRMDADHFLDLKIPTYGITFRAHDAKEVVGCTSANYTAETPEQALALWREAFPEGQFMAMKQNN